MSSNTFNQLFATQAKLNSTDLFTLKVGVHTLSDQLHRLSKRLLDVIVAFTAMVLLLPVFFGAITTIKLTSPGSAFFKQTRVGKNGKPFQLWKFRSMYLDAEQRKQDLMALNDLENNLLFKMKNDPRITPIGQFIRKYSIDELPQLINVLKGDMTLVGPRPAVPGEVSKYTEYQSQRLMAVPGITCIWQVTGRSNIPFEQQVELDLQYIKQSSLLLDIKLLLLTIPAVLTARGAY